MKAKEIKHEINIVKAFINIIWVSETGILEKTFAWLEYLEDQLSDEILKKEVLK